MKPLHSRALLAAVVVLFAADSGRSDPRGDAAGDADVPPFAAGLEKRKYLEARERAIADRRGIPHFLSYDPRRRALDQLEPTRASRGGVSFDWAQWVQIGPNPIPNGQVETGPQEPVSGRVSAIAVDPSDPATVYVGTAGGGVYRSINSGANWTPIFDEANSLAIGALALAPSDPDILYVGTGESALSADSAFGVGLYRIDDADHSATLSGPFNPLVTTGIANTTAFTGRSISEIVVHPTDPATIFVATTTGVGGNPTGGAFAFNVPPLALLGVYRSTNATSGTPAFTKLNVTTGSSVAPDTSGNLSITDIAIDPTDANRLVAWALGAAAADHGGVYLSTNALAHSPTFTQTLVTTTSFARGELAGNRVGATVTFYLAAGESTNGRLRKSTTGGASWSTFLTGAQNFCTGQCFYDIAVDVHPTNANILNVGGSPSLVAGRSTDGGATFTTNAQSAVGVHVDTHAIAIARADPTRVYLGTDGGIYRSTDSGITWTSLNNDELHATQFQSLALHPKDRNFLFGGTQDNGTQWMKPDGSWYRADFGDGGYALIDQNAINTTDVTVYHTYYNQATAKGFGRIITTADATEGEWIGYGCGFGGFLANGITCGAGDTTLFYAPMALGPGNPNTVYFGSDRLWRSADRGVTMPAVSQVLEFGFPISAIGIAPSNDAVRIAGTNNGKVYATTTGSTTLTNVTAAAMPDPILTDSQQRRPVSRIVFHPTNAQTAWVAFGGYGVVDGEHVWKTTNLAGGAGTWVAAGDGIPDVPVNSMVIDPVDPRTLYAATEIGVFVTRDSGGSWLPFGVGMPRLPVFDIAIHNGSERVLRVATHGRGIWEVAPLPLFRDGFESGNSSAWSFGSP